jgi:hypothetical protein
MSNRTAERVAADPIVIVGMEGCGTIIVARMLRRAGVYLGADLDEGHLNGVEFVDFDYRWTPPFNVAHNRGRPSGIGLERMGDELAGCCARHRVGIANERATWGWKHGPSIHLLPFLAEELPRLRVVHVLRDGRAAALAHGGARIHTLRLARAVLDGDGEPVTRGSAAWRGEARTYDGEAEATPHRQAAFWAASNSAAADFGERALGAHYLRMRIEDLLARPEIEIERLLSLAELDASPDELAEELPRGEPADAWTQRPMGERELLRKLMEPELLRFGYDDEPPPEATEPRAEISLPAPAGAPSIHTGNHPTGWTETAEEQAIPSVHDLDWTEHDFIDLGCSMGGSLQFWRDRMQARRGVGVDIDPQKVAQARRSGFDAVLGDAADLRVDGKVSFVSMIHFLEHLPGLNIVESVLESSAQAATDFLFIRHPSFEGEEYLRTLGLRQYWWDWSGHKSHIQIADYCQMLDRLGLLQYTIRYVGPVTASSDDSIHPIDAIDPHGWSNQGRYDSSVHPPKQTMRFERPLWRSQEILVALRPFQTQEWSEVAERLLHPPTAALWAAL